ncbi:xanthine dehydrogenase accessory protein XdhC [Aliishimia ponticola]|uniref:Xanthine dehydrogenase accessory protein XdhC n=1 Tax=Aliishimia ponticola TaxID=2499833 RepID=A0A4S4NJ13_9RHOB|nr:xanthine dehydrogenase accessory protein XdhC [Aliishimia ponticola]THH36080.1 xanthine dehydrogenase accessory protein XdhC [Aliishimia ponticola]
MSALITVTITETRGSTPREVGTSMSVGCAAQSGTIGGGALEWEATRIAREMLADGQTHAIRTFPLGPDLGQCCGGVVTLEFRAEAAPAQPPGAPLWIWGAGHVGRAVLGVLAPLPDFAITLVDTAPGRLPDDLPQTAAPLVAVDPPAAVPHAPKAAHHIIVTYSHDIDLKLCDALLRHVFASAGLIGSASKWARFRRRLGALGHSDAEISRITCPIGDPSLGKHPQAIALGVAASLLKTRTAGNGTA